MLELTARSDPVIPEKFPPNLLISPATSSKLGLDEIFMINLDRRKDRFERMKYNMNLLGIDFKHVSAVDGKQLNPQYISDNMIEVRSRIILTKGSFD